MALFKLICCSIIIGICCSVNIIEVANEVFVEFSPITVNLFEKDQVTSKIFEFGPEALEIPVPPMIIDIKDEATRNSMIDFAVERLAVANRKLNLHYKGTCTYESPRTKRVEPMTVMAGIGVVVLVGGIVGGTTYIIKQQIEINKLENEIINIKQNMNSAFELLNNVSKSSTLSEYAVKLRFAIISYIDHQLKISTDFVDLVKTKHALMYSELPNTFRDRFHGINNGTKFAMVQVLRCTSKNIKFEVSVMRETQTNQLNCNHYSHAGTFKSDRFDTRIIGNILCYQNEICYELDEEQCIAYFSEVNCTISSLSRCKCGPESLDVYHVKSVYAPPNFVETREFDNIVLIATKVKAYTVTTDNSKTSHLTPPSGVFSLNLHEKAILQIGHVKIYGVSKNATHISHVSIDSF